MTVRADRRRAMALLAASPVAAAFGSGARAQDGLDPNDWESVAAAARGQQVFWHAWGGDPNVNDYKEWVAERTQAEFGVSVTHVKLADTAEAVSRVLAERTAGNDEAGAVDLIWLNGENFASMKRNGLLYGPWAEALPNFALTAPERNPGVREDFTVPTDGYEAPYGAAQFVYMYDASVVADPPRSMAALAAWTAANRGRFAYPAPPDFLGSTFLKQALLELSEDPAPLYAAVDGFDVDAVAAPLWDFLDALHPTLWRSGRAFPQTGVTLRTLLGDGEVDIAFTFDPGAASAAIADGLLPPSVRTTTPEGGSIGNVNFVAIPYNARAKAGAMVVANFLLSPEAQARKADPTYWGGATVLDMAALAPDDRALFEALDLGPATLPPERLGAILPEPHPSWMERLEADWAARYAA